MNQYTYYREFTSPKDPQKHFIIRSIDKSELDTVAELITDVHIASHPVTINLPIIRRDVLISIMRTLVGSVIDQDLSVVAIDKATGKIVGFMGGYDNAKPWQMPNMDEQYPEFLPLIKCLGVFKERYPQYFNLKEEKKVAHLFFLVVDVEYQGYGLATGILQVVKDHSKLLEFDVLEGDAASKYSLSMLQKLDFKVVDSVEYEKLETAEGEHPFKDIKENLKKKNLSQEHLYFSFCVLDRTKSS